MGPPIGTGGSSSTSTNNAGTGAHLQPLPLLLLIFIVPALAVATMPQWWPACRGRRKRSRLPHPPPALGLAAVYPLRWVYR
jgi:hypothetical protein